MIIDGKPPQTKKKTQTPSEPIIILKSIQLLGYPHGHGNPHVKSQHQSSFLTISSPYLDGETTQRSGALVAEGHHQGGRAWHGALRGSLKPRGCGSPFHRGFHGRSPIAGQFIWENPNLKWTMTGGYHFRKLQIGGTYGTTLTYSSDKTDENTAIHLDLSALQGLGNAKSLMKVDDSIQRQKHKDFSRIVTSSYLISFSGVTMTNISFWVPNNGFIAYCSAGGIYLNCVFIARTSSCTTSDGTKYQKKIMI